MPLEYIIRFEGRTSQGGGRSPVPSGGNVPSSSPTTTKPEIPKQPAATPGTPATKAEIEQAVQRAAERSSAEKQTAPTSPVNGTAASTQQSTDQASSQPTYEKAEKPQVPEAAKPSQPRQPAGEATLDAIHAAVTRAEDRNAKAREAEAQQAGRTATPTETSKPIEIKIPEQPTAPKPQVNQPTAQQVEQKVVEVAQQAGEVPKAEKPGGGGAGGGDNEEFRWPDEKVTQPGSPSAPSVLSGALTKEQLQQLFGKAIGAAGLPGAEVAEALTGATGPAGIGLAGIGFAATAVKSYFDDISKMRNYSPEIARVQAQLDVKEQMRLIEQAAKYGEEDARNAEIAGNIQRAAKQYFANRVRSILSGEFITDVNPVEGLMHFIRDVKDVIDEFNRQSKPLVNPFEDFLKTHGHMPDPPMFSAAQMEFEDGTQPPVIGLQP